MMSNSLSWKALFDTDKQQGNMKAALPINPISKRANTELENGQVSGLADVRPSAVKEFDGMLERLGLDTNASPFKAITRVLSYLTCIDCSQRQACRLWLSGSGDKNGYKQFCPNAQTFNHLLGRDRWRGLGHK